MVGLGWSGDSRDLWNRVAGGILGMAVIVVNYDALGEPARESEDPACPPTKKKWLSVERF